MVIYLAGLQDIPSQLYEAIDIDGGTWFHKIKHVTLPLLSPVILFNVVIGLIQSFQQFAHVYIMTDGGPNNSTLLYALYLYRNAFSYMRMGYASALAWILFAIVFGTTLTIIRFSERRIYYSGQ